VALAAAGEGAVAAVGQGDECKMQEESLNLEDETKIGEQLNQASKRYEELKDEGERINRELDNTKKEVEGYKELIARLKMDAAKAKSHKDKDAASEAKERIEEQKGVRIRKDSLWKGAAAVAAFLLIVSLFFNLTSSSSSQIEQISLEKAAQDAVDYINSNLVQAGAKAVLTSKSDEGSIYKLKIDMGGNSFDSYITKDGKLLFPSGVNLEGGLEGGADAPSAPAPQASGPANQQSDISADDDPSVGPANAPVTIIEFSDYQCPFCKRVEPAIRQVLDTYKDKVRLVYRDFPLSFHQNAQKAAEASECADEQGKFWEYHDLLFERQAEWSSEGNDKLKEYASSLGLDAKKFNECLDSGKYASEVQKDLNDGQSYGVAGTPAFFINGIEVSGAQPFSSFQQVIDTELSKASSSAIPSNQNNAKEITVKAFKFGYSPDTITVSKGERIKLKIDNTDATHGIRIPDLGVSGNDVVEFTAGKAGEFAWYCNNYCGDGHSQMSGRLIVK